MPLIKGYSDKSKKKNIETLIREGKRRDVAVAIALDIQREALKKRKKK